MSADAPADDEWTVATTEDDGHPLVFRIRQRPPAYATGPAYPHLMAVQWAYDPNTGAGGMPHPDEVERMGELEELLVAGLEETARAAFLTAVVTGNGVREWQWYATSPDAAMEQVNAALGHLDPFPVEFSFQDDPAWAAYGRLRDALE
ncbi:MAG TPA: DUF695 domain-containing protein [Humisphaera sp.]